MPQYRIIELGVDWVKIGMNDHLTLTLLLLAHLHKRTPSFDSQPKVNMHAIMALITSTLMMNAGAVSETFDLKAILTWLIAPGNFTVLSGDMTHI
jgi:hypothetical protein